MEEREEIWKVERSDWETLVTILLYIGSFGTLYLVRVLLSHAIRCALKEEK